MSLAATGTETTAETAAPAASAADALQSGGDLSLWIDYSASALAAAEEAEGFEGFADMIEKSDAVVVGRVATIEFGYVEEIAPGVPGIPWATFLIEADRVVGPAPVTDAQGRVLLVMPFRATSPELEAAIAASGDEERAARATTDEEIARAFDDEAIRRAYDEYYEAAARRTVEEMNATTPTATSMFVLRGPTQTSLGDVYRLVNGSGVLAEEHGAIVLPLRLDQTTDPVAQSLEGVSSLSQLIAAAETALGL